MMFELLLEGRCILYLIAKHINIMSKYERRYDKLYVNFVLSIQVLTKQKVYARCVCVCVLVIF